MSNFGQTLFGRSGFIRWALTPLVLIFAIFMPLLIDKWTPVGVAIMVGMELMCLALLAGFWLPARIGPQWVLLVLIPLKGYQVLGYADILQRVS